MLRLYIHFRRCLVSVLRFYQEWVHRNTTQVLAARSQFSFGIDAFDATVNNTGTDGRFFSWLGQFQWVQQLSKRILLLTRITTQLTPDSLLSLEKFSIGGVDTVWGYRQNQLVQEGKSKKAKVKRKNAYFVGFLAILNGWFIYAVLY